MKTKEYLTPTIDEEGNYTLSQTVDGGHLARSSYASYHLKTTWNKDLKLLKFFIDDDNVLYFFDEKGKLRKDIQKRNLKDWHTKGDFNFTFHGPRALRAYNYHLKCLKIFLGQEQKETIKEKEFIYRPYYDGKIRGGIVPLTKEGKPNLRSLGSNGMPIVELTPEKVQFAKEYNEKLATWESEKKRLTTLIFGAQ